jgi:long-chain fatty acid transport protein
MKNTLGGAVLAALFLLAGGGPAVAAGFLIRENSAAAVGMSYAGTGSRADAAETAFANPAGMTRLTSDEVESGGAVIVPDFRFSGSATAFGAPISGNTGGNSGRVAGVPNLYGVLAISDKWKAGLAVTVPFGNTSVYDSAWYGRYLGIKTSALSYDINPSVAYQITDTLSVGAGFSAQYLKLDVTSAIDQSILAGAPVPDATYRFNAHDWSYGFNLGVLLQVSETTRVGAYYRSQIDHTINGSLNFSGASPLLGLVNGPASSGVSLPDTAGLSVTSELDPDLSISSEVQFTHWDVFKDVVIKSQNVPFDNHENFRNSWMLAVGAAYRLSPHWTVSSGIAWDQTPVTSAFRGVSLPDTDRYLLGFGTRVELTDSIILDGAYGHSFAFLRPNMDVSANNTDSITHAVVLKGRYDIAVDIVAFSAHYKF